MTKYVMLQSDGTFWLRTEPCHPTAAPPTIETIRREPTPALPEIWKGDPVGLRVEKTRFRKIAIDYQAGVVVYSEIGSG